MDMTFNWLAYSGALPEAFLCLSALGLLLLGVFLPERLAFASVASFSRLSLVMTGLIMIVSWYGLKTFSVPFVTGGDLNYTALYVQDYFSLFMKIIILIVGFFSLTLGQEYLKYKNISSPEYYILHLISILGMMVMVSANNLMMLYVGLEMMSFCLYILAAYNRDDIKSSEAGLKYFVLGSLASCLMLYGISLLYGITGSTSFAAIQDVLVVGVENAAHQNILVVSLVLILTGAAFKVSAAPFHMWTPDVYEGAPTSVTAFMATAPKVAAFVVLIRLLHQPLLPMMQDWSQILAVLSVLTMAVGSLMAIVQEDVKRLLAFSSIGHVGFILVGLSVGNIEGIQAAILYLVIYVIMVLGSFSVLLCLRRRNIYMERIASLSGLAKRSPFLAICMGIFMFSLAGIPPFSGFLAKYASFSAAIKGGYTWLAICGVIFSVVAAYYCLKIIKVMFFEEGNGKLAKDVSLRLKFVVFLMALLTVLLGLFPSILADQAMLAASSLF